MKRFHTVEVLLWMISPTSNAVSHFIFLQWGEAGATVGGARPAEVPSHPGTVNVVGALIIS